MPQRLGGLFQGGMSAIVAGLVLLFASATNLFGILGIFNASLGDIGAGIVAATGALALAAGVASYVPKMPNPLNKGVVTGFLTVLVGVTNFFGILTMMNLSLSPVAQGIVIGFGAVTLLGGLLSAFNLGRLGR